MPDRPVDPSRDVRAMVAERSGVPDPANKIWFHKTAAAVIDAGRCVRCGTCVAACPSQSLAIAEDRLPTLVKMCTGCSRCWDMCPMAGLRTERLWTLEQGDGGDRLGPLLDTYSARARDRSDQAQDGGVVTALLEALLAAGTVGEVLVTRQAGPILGEPQLATSAAGAREGAGSIYDQSMPLATFAGGGGAPGRVAVVGTPCQINGLRTLQRFPWRQPNAAGSVVLTIALFCTRSFDPTRLMVALARQGMDLARVAKVRVEGAVLQCLDASGDELGRWPVKTFADAALRGCDECPDLTGRLADISVGSVGSPAGSSTVLVRTARGQSAWDVAAARLDATAGCDLSLVQRHEETNWRNARRARQRPFDTHANLWVSYEEHLQQYSGSDRAPVSPPAFRSHRYTTAC